MQEEVGLKTILEYKEHLQNYGAELISQCLEKLSNGHFEQEMDGGQRICVRITINSKRACVDFSGTSSQLDSNFNALRQFARPQFCIVLGH